MNVHGPALATALLHVNEVNFYSSVLQTLANGMDLAFGEVPPEEWHLLFHSSVAPFSTQSGARDALGSCICPDFLLHSLLG